MEILPFVTLSALYIREIIQTEKNHYCMISHVTSKIKKQTHRYREQTGEMGGEEWVGAKQVRVVWWYKLPR